MKTFDVHAFCGVRIKIAGVAAETPLEALRKVDGDEAVYAEASRLIDREGMQGPIVDMEFQSSDVPSAYQIDAVDQAEHDAHPDGWAYAVDADGEPRPVRFLFPSEYQDAVIQGFAGERLIDARDDVIGAARRLRRAGHVVGASLFEALQGCAGREQAVAMVDDLIASLDRVRSHLTAASPTIVPDGGVA